VTVIDLGSPEGLKNTLEGILARQDNTDTALAKLAGPGLTAETALEGSGVAAFRAKDGKLRLTAAQRRDTVEHGGETYVVESTVPGLLDKGATAHLSADEAATVNAYRETLAEINACKALGVRVLPSEMLGRLMHLADGAPATLRGELTSHSRTVAAASSASIRRHGSLASSSAGGASVPGYSWVADDYLPDAVDVTDQAVGLYDIVLRSAGGPGLHETAKLKVRVLTGTGGMNIMGRQTTNTVGAFPKTDVATSVLELTGKRAVHASLIDGASLRDPREAVDWLALHRRAGALSLAATADYVLLHGDEETAPASHPYGVAGLQALVLDHRDAASAGSGTDPLLLADGLRKMAADRSATVDLATGLSVAASAVFSSQANGLAAMKLLRNKIGSQYKRGAALIVTQEVADQFARLSVGVQGLPFFTPATAAGNPFLVGTLFDGTPVLTHFGVSTLFNSSGVVASGASLCGAFLVNASTLVDVQGPDHGRFVAADVVDGDARLVTTFFQRKPWLALPTAKVPVAFGFNFSV
jgi:hypothetical protein